MDDSPESLSDNHLFPPNKVNTVVINNLMKFACESNETEKAFAKYVHHRNLSVQKDFTRVK